MKPSEKIKKFFEYFSYTSIGNNRVNVLLKAISSHLDEDAEKSKYACPNCHRIVDELITITEADQERPDGSIDFLRPVKARSVGKCKHCCADANVPRQNEFKKILEDAAAKQLKFVAENREKLLTAWVAETGLLPSESMIVERRQLDGSLQISIEKKIK